MRKYRSTKLRAIVKSVTWRILSSSADIALIWFLVHFNLILLHDAREFAGTVGVIIGIESFILYYFHERIWAHFSVSALVKRFTDVDWTKHQPTEIEQSSKDD